MDKRKILIVEDDADINYLLKKILEKEGFDTVQAFSGSEARLCLKGEEFDLIALDLMLPGVSGEELIRLIRQVSEVPVIVLSAKTGLSDRVDTLNMGADDYLTKPFEKEEVAARVHAALRRYKKDTIDVSKSRIYKYKNLELNEESRTVTVCKEEIGLTAHEYDILHLLLENPAKVYSRDFLYGTVWGNGYYGEDNTVNVHVSNLRKKISSIDSEEYIKTVWGIGFKMA